MRGWIKRILPLAAFAIVAGGCVTLTPQQQEKVAEVQQFADATAAHYRLTRIPVTIEPSTNLGIGGRYRQGNFYLNERMLGSGHLLALVAHELAHYVLGHDAPVPGSSMGEFQRAQEQRELDANAKAVEVLMRVKGLTQRHAVQTMVVLLRSAQAFQERGGAGAWGHRPPAEEIADLRLRFPAVETPAEPRGVADAAPSTPVAAILAPAWTPGDEWRYWWASPQGAGTFLWSVSREESVDGVEHYVVKSGTQREIFVRKSDLATYLLKVGGDVETRYVPPEIRLPWPLVAGAEWEQTVTTELVKVRTNETVTRACRVESEESLTVPAGTFRVFRTVCRSRETDQVIYQGWYSPEVKTWVREWRPVSGGVLERELIAYKLR